MRELALCSISALDRPLAAAAEAAAGADLAGLEVTARPPHLDPEAGLEAAREAGRAVAGAGLKVVAYGSYLGRADGPPAEAAGREAEIAAALGAPLLRVWAEPLGGAGPREDHGLPRVVAMLREACEVAERHGIHVVVERHQGSFADTPERVERLLEEVDRENLALNYQVLDLLPPSQAASQPDDAARLAGDARYFHLKNYQRNPDAGGPLLPGGSIESGVLDYRAILNAALDAGYAGPLSFEFLSFAPKPLEEKLASEVAFVTRILAARESS